MLPPLATVIAIAYRSCYCYCLLLLLLLLTPPHQRGESASSVYNKHLTYGGGVGGWEMQAVCVCVFACFVVRLLVCMHVRIGLFLQATLGPRIKYHQVLLYTSY